MAVVDYLPVATGAGADVDTQAQFVGSGYQQNGFVVGIAQPSQANKIWRQASMISAAVAKTISDLLNIDLLDDGNLPNLVANLKAALATGASGGVLTQATRPFGDNSTDVANTAFVQAAVSPVSGVANGAATSAAAAAAAAAAAQGTANTGVANAATAQAAANAAQGSANTALADIAALEPTTTRNANGTFVQRPDGAGGFTYEAWGEVAAAITGTRFTTANIVFPVNFPGNPVVITTPLGDSDGSGNNAMSCYADSVTVAGFTAMLACATNIGGSGSSGFHNAVTVQWHAKF